MRELNETEIAAFKELCADRREGVKERLQFAAIFGAVLVGFIGLYRPSQPSAVKTPGSTPASQSSQSSTPGSTSAPQTSPGPIAVSTSYGVAFVFFLMVFSLLGMLVTLKSDVVVKSQELAFKLLLVDKPKTEDLREVYVRYPPALLKKISIGRLIPMFFLASFCVLLTFLPIPKCLGICPAWLLWPLAIIVFVLGWCVTGFFNSQVKEMLDQIADGQNPAKSSVWQLVKRRWKERFPGKKGKSPTAAAVSQPGGNPSRDGSDKAST